MAHVHPEIMEGIEADYAAGAPAEGPPAQPLPVVLEDLLQRFNQDLNYANPSWVGPIREILTKLFLSVVLPDAQAAFEAAAAVTLLTGVIAELRILRGTTGMDGAVRVPTPVEALRLFLASDSPQTEIIQFAQFLRNNEAARDPAIPRGPRRPVTTTVAQSKAEAACARGRPSLGARILAEAEPRVGTEPGAFPQRRPALEAAEVARLVQELFPEATPEDSLDDDIPDPAPMEISVEDVRRTIKFMKTDKAAGHSGWTPRLFKSIALSGTPDQQETFASRLTLVFNMLLSGTAHQSLHDLWTCSRIALLPKDEVAFRPIGIGEVLSRCLAATTMRILGPKLALDLQPLQLAIGVKGGVEIAAVIADLGYSAEGPRREISTMSIDIKNAFNSMPRYRILLGLRESCPELIRYFKWTYGSRVTIRDGRGAIAGYSNTGTMQGDPLSSLYFSVGFQPVLVELLETLRTAEIETDPNDDAPRGLVVAIADDVAIQGTTAALFALATLVPGILDGYGLTTNLRKSFIVGPTVFSTPDPPEGWHRTLGGCKTLGRPLGAAADQEEWIRQKLVEQRPPMEGLGAINPRAAWMLLRMCFNPRPDYLQKVVSPLLDRSCFDVHDTHIDEAFHRLLKGPTPEYMRELRELPIDLGGFNLPTLYGVAANRHLLVTCVRTVRFLETYHQDLLDVHREKFFNVEGLNQDSVLYELNHLTEARLLLDFPDNNSVDAFITTAKKCSSGLVRARAAALHLRLAAAPKTSAFAAQLLSSSTPNAAYWLRSTSLPAYGSGVAITPSIFLELIRNRAHVDFSTFHVHGGTQVLCTCNRANAVDIAQVPLHPLSCQQSNGTVIGRHDNVTARLARLLRSVLPGGGHVQIEPTMHNGQAFTRRPDLCFIMENGVPTYVDVVVAEPTSPTALQDHQLPSATVAGAAATAAEGRKNHEYNVIHAAQGIQVKPFAIESTGRLGAEAHALLTHVCRDNPRELKAFLFDLSFILAVAKGRLLTCCRTRLTTRDR
jgi:hypothetical protein